MAWTYESLNEITGSWGLIAFFVFFCCAVALALMPSARRGQEEASRIPLKED